MPKRVEETNGTLLPTRIVASRLFAATISGVESTRTSVVDAIVRNIARTPVPSRRTSRSSADVEPVSGISGLPNWPATSPPRLIAAQFMPNSDPRPNATSAMVTSNITCAGRVSSASMVSRSSGKFGGAVRITSAFVGALATMVVRPTSRPAAESRGEDAVGTGAVMPPEPVDRCRAVSASRARNVSSARDNERSDNDALVLDPTAIPKSCPSAPARSSAAAYFKFTT